jgi:hypothetical protein
MGQLTKEFVEGMIKRTDPDGGIRQHQQLTVWEEHQFAARWLLCDALALRVEQLEKAIKDASYQSTHAAQWAILNAALAPAESKRDCPVCFVPWGACEHTNPPENNYGGKETL